MDDNKPSANAYPEFGEARARDIIVALSNLAGATLPILHALQAEFGCVDQRVVPMIADALNSSRAEVHGCVSFYQDFRSAPAGRHILKLCRAEACQSMGVNRLVERLETMHGLGLGSTSVDGGLTIEAVYCLGNCALSPAALLDGEPVGRLDDDAIDEIVSRCAGGRS